jgi:acetyltransferase-like isoleucine patch superfamily enzyme
LNELPWIEEERVKLSGFLAGSGMHHTFDIPRDYRNIVRNVYSVVFPGLKRPLFYLRFFVARLAQFMDYSPVKVFLYRLTGMRIGKGVFISPEVFLDPHFPGLINIEDHVILGWGCRIFTHDYFDYRYRLGRVNIGEGALIGAYSTLRCGINIGKEAQIAFGSIVYEDVRDGAKELSSVRRGLREGT